MRREHDLDRPHEEGSQPLRDFFACHAAPQPFIDLQASSEVDLWVDGKFYFTSGAGTRKSRNLAQRADCVISVKLPDLDLIVEGAATKVTDGPTLRRLAELYDAQGWPATVKDGAFIAPYSAPSAGPPPWDLFEFTPTTVFGVATAEPYGATRWLFQT